ncbi:MAG TPA: hypothetical protein PLJ35_12205 [Anaerolineae bacterium]|mgnify:CR=1 FL=1|nr:hypothetical protein [Anaerolineae bacterium]HPL27715.1 hypothetical protein [Anaerolineae bacterium]
MTHTLHRLGTPESLHDDYVVLAMSGKGVNETGSHVPLRRFMEIALELNPVNAGESRTGNILTRSIDEVMAGIEDISTIHAVYTDPASVATLLRRVSEEQLGISVVVSGLFDRVCSTAGEAGVRQHTVEYSLGVWGQVDRLPNTDVLQIVTMCGHNMVTAESIERAVRDIRQGRATPLDAARALAGKCVCGIFNPVRAARLLKNMADGSAPAARPM